MSYGFSLEEPAWVEAIRLGATLSVQEVAMLACVSERTMRRRLRAGKAKYYRDGHRIRIYFETFSQPAIETKTSGKTE